MLKKTEFGKKVSFTDNVKRAAMHAISYYIGQVLMMIFMVYNGYFCLSLVMGRFTGFLLVQQFSSPPSSQSSAIQEDPQIVVKSCCS